MRQMVKLGNNYFKKICAFTAPFSWNNQNFY